MTDQIEFYDGGLVIARIKSSIVPVAGSCISIQGKTWRVEMVTYAIDYCGTQRETMRANVDLREINRKPTRRASI